MTTPNELTDKALAVFAFAIYHQLNSGDTVSAVIASDDHGHQVDQQALDELKAKDLARLEDGKVVFTAAGALMIAQLVDRLRGTW